MADKKILDELKAMNSGESHQAIDKLQTLNSLSSTEKKQKIKTANSNSLKAIHENIKKSISDGNPDKISNFYGILKDFRIGMQLISYQITKDLMNLDGSTDYSKFIDKKMEMEKCKHEISQARHIGNECTNLLLDLTLKKMISTSSKVMKDEINKLVGEMIRDTDEGDGDEYDDDMVSKLIEIFKKK